jgi:signal transduction histidine kinase
VALVPGPVIPPKDSGAGLRLWWMAVAAGLLWCGVFAAVPEGNGTPGNAVYVVGELLATVAIVAGVRLYRPRVPVAWLLIAAALSAFLAGDILWLVYEARGIDPYPSAADVLYLAGYPLLAAGLVIAMIRRRVVGVDGRESIDAALDAALLTVIAALLSFVYIVLPAVNDDSISSLERAVTIAYPVGDLLLLAVAARFVMGASWNVPALRVLVLGLAVVLVGDTLYSLEVVREIGVRQQYSDTLLLLGVILTGLAALHPTMPALTEERGDPPAHSGLAGVVLLGGACLVPPAVLVVQSLRDEPLHLAATTTAVVAITALVVARFTLMAARARRAAAREAALRRYAGELLRSHGTDEVIEVAGNAARELLRAGTTRVVVPPEEAPPTGGAFSMPVKVDGELAAELVVDAEPEPLRRARDSLATVATQLALALERERLLAQEQAAAKVLAEQNERLRELDRMKDQFVGTVSHELRTPLTSMLGYLELVLEGEVGDLGDDQRHFLDIVNRNCARLNTLIDDILEVSRIDAGRMSLKKEWVDLGELMPDAVELARAAAERNDVVLRLSAPKQLQLCADPVRLRQLLDNLMSNAIKFTPRGGTVAVSASSRGELARLEVSDTGVGIPEQEVGNLFDRFFRASTAASIQGTGLGLSIVKSIVELHGGTIAVDSEVGAGTSFRVELPIGSPPSETSAEDPIKEVAT